MGIILIVLVTGRTVVSLDSSAKTPVCSSVQQCATLAQLNWMRRIDQPPVTDGETHNYNTRVFMLQGEGAEVGHKIFSAF